MLAEVGHVSLITPRASQQGSVLHEARMVGSSVSPVDARAWCAATRRCAPP